MNTKTITIISICALALLSTISGVTYSVFCDTETSYGTMMVNTDYYSPIPEWNILEMAKNVNNPNAEGTFGYWDAGPCLRYIFNGTVKSSDGGAQSDQDHNWTLIVMLNDSHALEIGQGMTINSSEVSRTLVIDGCTNFDKDLSNMPIGLLQTKYFNTTDGGYDNHHVYLISVGYIEYYDTNKPEGEPL
jgi:hypothetical protein